MSVAIRSLYLVTDVIKEELLSSEFINTVTFGDITEVDLNKQTMYPLSHLMLNNVTSQERVLEYNMTIFLMDIVDVSKESTTDIFVGNDNEQDVLNTMLSVGNKLAGKLRRGTLYKDKYQLVGNAEFEPFTDRFENRVAGWAMTFTVMISNDIDIC